jgi:hypothetical protein
MIILDSDDFIDVEEFSTLLNELRRVEGDAIFTNYNYYLDNKGKTKRRTMHRTRHYVKRMKKMFPHM